MKLWNAPVMEELDVKETAKGPGTVEQNAHSGTDGWVTATYNSATHEWNEAANGIDGCLGEIKAS